MRAPEVRLIDENGKMLGVFSSYDALKQAEARGLDLIEIAPGATPPTCRIMDYGKWKYENKKKALQSKKKQVVISTKEIQIRPRTDQHDIDIKMRQARRFLLDGDKVKINMRFVGRELAYQDSGLEVLANLAQTQADICMLETPPKKEGKQMFVLLAPDHAKIKLFKKNEQRKTSEKSEKQEPPEEGAEPSHESSQEG